MFRTIRLNRRAHIATLLTSVSAVVVPAPSAADAVDGAADITEITISATKNPVAAFSVPAAVSVVSKREIDDQVASSISDIFASVPGLSFDGGPRRSGQTPTLRGIAGEGVVVLFDGVRQSFLSGHDGRFFIEPDLLKSAEVVRGGGSALYGSGAVGGVITLNTVDASDLVLAEENAGYRLSSGFQGVNNEWMYGATVFGRSDDGRLDGVASLSFRSAGDIALGDGSSLPAKDSIGSGLVKGSYQVSDALKLSGSWLGYRDDAVEPNNGQGNNVGDLMEKRIVSDTFRAGIDYNPASNHVDFHLIGFINTANVEEQDQDSDRLINRDVETIGVSFDNRSRFEIGNNASLLFTYGGEYYRDSQIGTDTNVADGTRGGVPNARSKTLGFFAQAEYLASTAVGDFILIPGIRYDEFRNTATGENIETKESATSPKVSLTWQPTDGLMVYSSYSEAFRAPSYNEIFADDIHFTIPLGPGVSASNVFIPNADLQSERSKTWEFGAGFNQNDLFAEDDQFTVKGAYYSSDVRDLIDLEVNFAFSMPCFVPTMPGDCNAGTSRNINTSRADMSGFELEAVYDNPAFRLQASYSTVNGTDTEADAYVGILSPNRLYVSAEAKFAALDARFGARTNIAGKFDKVNDVADEREGYETLDLFLIWQPRAKALKGLRVDMAVDNLFDTATETVFAGVVDAGRNIKTRVSWTGSF